ncbi:hypothetical protein JCM21900_001781 [Sporobolomyces salmonicolor]
MLICILGPTCSGRNTLADHLSREHGFTRVRLASRSRDPDPGANELHFASSSDFLDHATRTWRRNYVTTDLTSKPKVVEFAKRPFVAVVAVDAPLGVRFKRAVKDAQTAGLVPPTLDEFVAADDLDYHGALPFSSSAQNDALPPNELLSNLSLDAPPTVTPSTPTKQRLMPSSSGPPSPTPSPFRISPLPPSRPAIPPPSDTLTSLLPLALTTLSNPYATPSPFFSSFSLPSLSEHLRPSWDTYFMALASLASLRSNCMKRRVGAVLVRDKRVVSTGYNGTPRGVRNCSEGGCGRCNNHGDGWGDDVGEAEEARGGEAAAKGKKGMSRVGEALDECLCLHAEENALLEAGRERVSGGGTDGAVLYCNTCPCLRCTVKIVQCGVKEVIYSLSYSMDAASRRVMEEAGVVLRQMEGVPAPV